MLSFFAHRFCANFEVDAFYLHLVKVHVIKLVVDVIHIAVGREGPRGAGREYCRVFIVQCGIGASAL